MLKEVFTIIRRKKYLLFHPNVPSHQTPGDMTKHVELYLMFYFNLRVN